MIDWIRDHGDPGCIDAVFDAGKRFVREITVRRKQARRSGGDADWSEPEK